MCEQDLKDKIAKMNDTELTQEWEKLQKKAKSLVAKENTFRRALAERRFAFDEDRLQKGTENIELNNGFKLKCVFSLNETLNQKEVSNAIAELKALKTPARIINNLFKYKASVVAASYKNLSPEEKQVIDKIRTFSPAMPAITIVEPKK